VGYQDESKMIELPRTPKFANFTDILSIPTPRDFEAFSAYHMPKEEDISNAH
jgi:hypothetical protein